MLGTMDDSPGYPKSHFTSQWALGCIHRGEAWRTVNLSKINNNMPVGCGYIAEESDTNARACTYTDGDAHILDQIRVHSQLNLIASDTRHRLSFGTIDLNRADKTMLSSVFQTVNVGTEYG